ncbi:MAG: hypothetical protein SFU56_18955 [Capsulimonadales bacterium]|nr:hypothetical protein [Capsulimonadales bacterium]
MAVWQAKFNISTGYTLPSGWKYWSGYKRLQERLSEIMPMGNSWHKDLQCWGQDGGNQAELWLREDDSGTFNIRVDLRGDYFDFISKISLILAELGLKVEHDGDVVEPDANRMLSIAQGSNAFRFVSDPHRFIRHLRQESHNQ